MSGWITPGFFSSVADFDFVTECAYADFCLSMRSFMIALGVSIADIALWSALAGTGQRWESLRKSEKYADLVRRYNSITADKRGSGKSGATQTKVEESQKQSKSPIGRNNDKAKASGHASSETDLPHAEVGKVCLRFAPEPSGYLHIGHAKAALLNKYFAEKYEGRLIIRFDDTNPAKESNEFVVNLLKDIKSLGIVCSDTDVTYTSDYFPQLMKMAEDLIQQGKAYVDDTPKKQMKEERRDGIKSKCRNISVDENIKLWKEMIAGSEKGVMCCLRGKLDMQDPNKSLQDPIYYRCNRMPHHRTGSKYKLYPTYDFACPFVDSMEGITHALRSSEYHDRNAQYHGIQGNMGLRKVHIYEFSRLNMVYTPLSKRILRRYVQGGKVDGWDDPGFPTVQGIVRRGLKIEALIQFILEQGPSKNLNLMELDKLWTINKKIIDPVCPRHTAVIAERLVLVTLLGGPEKPFVCIIL
ncbi:hypothetical protein Droror1_Dr00020352 [Drosera rotundifolia]